MIPPPPPHSCNYTSLSTSLYYEKHPSAQCWRPSSQLIAQGDSSTYTLHALWLISRDCVFRRRRRWCYGYQVSQTILLGLDFCSSRSPLLPLLCPTPQWGQPCTFSRRHGIANLPNQVCERIFALPALHTDTSNCDRGIRLSPNAVGFHGCRCVPIHLDIKL